MNPKGYPRGITPPECAQPVCRWCGRGRRGGGPVRDRRRQRWQPAPDPGGACRGGAGAARPTVQTPGRPDPDEHIIEPVIVDHDNHHHDDDDHDDDQAAGPGRPSPERPNGADGRAPARDHHQPPADHHHDDLLVPDLHRLTRSRAMRTQAFVGDGAGDGALGLRQNRPVATKARTTSRAGAVCRPRGSSVLLGRAEAGNLTDPSGQRSTTTFTSLSPSLSSIPASPSASVSASGQFSVRCRPRPLVRKTRASNRFSASDTSRAPGVPHW